MRITLGELADQLSCTYRGDAKLSLSALATLENASLGCVSFLDNPRYLKYLKTTQASVVILKKEFLEACPVDAIISDQPYLSYAKAATLFNERPVQVPGIHGSAIIAPDASIAEGVAIGANAVIEAGVRLEANVVIGPLCVIGAGARIGKGTRLFARVTVYDGVHIGAHCEIHAGAVIGSDGFGHARTKNTWVKIPQLGTVRVEDEVEIGANTTIDRGSIGDTVIKRGAVIDNLVQIAHNVEIGELTAIAACTGIAGSAKIGKRCLIGGGVGINGHVDICDDVALTGMAMVTASIHEPGVYSSGTGLLANLDWRKSAVRFRQLDKLAARLADIEKILKEVKS